MAKNKAVEFAVIGAGRFGIFWARHISAFYPVSMYDINPDCRKAVSDFAQWRDLKECLTKPYIFLTVPIRRLRKFLSEHRQIIQPGTTIIDCASIKEPVMKWVGQELSEETYYVASHPLFGPDSARAGLKDHMITLIPGRVPYEIYHFLVSFFENDLQLSVENIPAQEHDRLMAYNLSLIHHLGRTFDGMNISRIPLMMDSLSKLNSISKVVMNDSEELFADFYTFNRFSRQVTDQFREQFGRVLKNAGSEPPGP